MSIKIKASYVMEAEKQMILKMLKPLLDKGYRYKIKKGNPRSLIYIQQKDDKGGSKEEA